MPKEQIENFFKTNKELEKWHNELNKKYDNIIKDSQKSTTIEKILEKPDPDNNHNHSVVCNKYKNDITINDIPITVAFDSNLFYSTIGIFHVKNLILT